MPSRALIIANSRYEDGHFAELPGATADAAALAEVLGDPAIGGFAVESLVDARQRDAMRAMEAFFTRAGRDDLLLLHLSLHGWKDLRGRLYFVMSDTERDLPGATAIPADRVSDWMEQSRSRRIVVMLDCCYSGAFAMNAVRRAAGPPAVDVAEPFAGNGRVVLTASTALQYAYEGRPDGAQGGREDGPQGDPGQPGQPGQPRQDVRFSRQPAQPSVFTAAVVRGLKDGSADLDGDGLVSVEELYAYVHEQVRQSIAGQTPTLSVDNAQGVIHLARSPRHDDVDRLTEMRAAVLDRQAWKRIGALHLVEGLLGSVREPTRDAARAALLGLIADADLEVAARARQLWHKRGLGEIPRVGPPRPQGRSGRPGQPEQAGQPGQAGQAGQAAGEATAATPGALVGIDFGTTNSSIGLFEGDDVRLVPNAEGSLTTPSMVAITAGGEILVGAAAKRQAVTNAAYTVRAAKLRLGTGWSITRGGVTLTAEDVAAHILARLRADAEAYWGGPLRGAVLTVPATFGHAQRDALARAGRKAGLVVHRMINEPTAAALTYGLAGTESDALVFDLGGGTLDVSLIEVSDGVVDVKAGAGDEHLGGGDWDARLVRHLADRVRERYGVDVTGDAQAMQRLQEAAEDAKIELSAATSATVSLPFLATAHGTPVHLQETVTRAEFEAMTRDLLERCRRPVEQALRDAGIGLADLDRVILTGGATRMPAIDALMRRLTGGKAPYRGLIPEGIVTGAALQAGVLTGSVKDALLLDVTPMTLGIALQDGWAMALIERNTTIPTLRTEFLATSAASPRAMTLRLVEGSEETADANRTLAVLELPDLRRAGPGMPSVVVGLDIDANGIVHLVARERSGRARSAKALREEERAFRDAVRGGSESALDEITDAMYAGRQWSVTVDAAAREQAAALMRSERWAALRASAPVHWTPPPEPEGS
jgi:molecular chaperone DnaK